MCENVLLGPLIPVLISFPSGYVRQYRGLREFLAKQSFADRIEVIPKEDRGVTGNFEVTGKSTGEVLHSKRVAGQGRAETAKERQDICEQIMELLE